MRCFLLFTAGCLMISAALFAQSDPVVVTRQDLIDMAEAGLPATLMIKTIEGADEVPTLQPAEVAELAKSGVPAEALEAVLDRRRVLQLTKRPEPEIDLSRRRVRVSARLENNKKWFRRFGRNGEPLAVYWAARIEGDAARSGLQCPRESLCVCSDADGKPICIDPSADAYSERFDCVRVVEMGFGGSSDIFDFHLAASPKQVRVYPFVLVEEKNGERYMEAWQTSASPRGEGDQERRPGYAAISPAESNDFTAELELALELVGSAQTDFRIETTRFDNRDPRVGVVAGAVAVGAASENELLPNMPSGCFVPRN